MASEKKSRGRAPGPGIPFRIQTPKQKAVVNLIKSLGSFNYPDDTTYIAGRFMGYDAIVHMNMKLLAGVLEFIREYNILSALDQQKIMDLTKIEDINSENISNLLLRVFSKTDNPEQETRRQVDFIRYLYFAIGVLKSSEQHGDNSTEIKQLLINA